MGVRSLNRNNATSGSTWLASGNAISQCLGFKHHHRKYVLYLTFIDFKDKDKDKDKDLFIGR